MQGSLYPITFNYKNKLSRYTNWKNKKETPNLMGCLRYILPVRLFQKNKYICIKYTKEKRKLQFTLLFIMLTFCKHSKMISSHVFKYKIERKKLNFMINVWEKPQSLKKQKAYISFRKNTIFLKLWNTKIKKVQKVIWTGLSKMNTLNEATQFYFIE